MREHQFLAATDNVDYTFTRVKGAANMLLRRHRLLHRHLLAPAQARACVWLHGYGNVFEVTLSPGEQIDIEPGGWIYKDRSVQMQTISQRLSAGLLASAGQLVWNRFTGPGRIGLQSMYVHLETEK